MRTEHLTLSEIRAYSERTLAPDNALEVSDHLVGCAECRALLQREERRRGAGKIGRSSVAYEELAAYADNQFEPFERREVFEKLSRTPAARRELRDLLEFKAEMETTAADSFGSHHKWILPIAAGILIAVTFGWWSSANKTHDVAFELSPELRATLQEAITQHRFSLPKSIADLQSARERLAGAPVGPRTDFKLISPVGTAVATRTPVFRWSKVENATGYRVTIVRRGGDEIASSVEVNGNQTTWTPTESFIVGETYLWEVEAIDGENSLAKAPTPPEPEAGFYILNQPQQDELTRQRIQFGRSHLALGLIYARAGLIDEANVEFDAVQQANPSSDLPHQLRDALENSRAK